MITERNEDYFTWVIPFQFILGVNGEEGSQSPTKRMACNDESGRRVRSSIDKVTGFEQPDSFKVISHHSHLPSAYCNRVHDDGRLYLDKNNFFLLNMIDYENLSCTFG